MPILARSRKLSGVSSSPSADRLTVGDGISRFKSNSGVVDGSRYSRLPEEAFSFLVKTLCAISGGTAGILSLNTEDKVG